MEEQNKFWFNIWKITGIVVVTTFLIISVWASFSSQRWYSAWNKCVELGGQPVQQTLVGSNYAELTCVRK